MKIAFVALTDPSPALDGGRIRMTGLISALTLAGHDVNVIFPDSEVTSRRSKNPRHFLRLAPRQGSLRITRKLVREIVDAKPDLILYSISYMACLHRIAGIPAIVDFQNIEGTRYSSIAARSRGIHGVAAHLEAAKARIWEPRVARRVDLVLGVSGDEVRVLSSWRANAILIPHGSDGIDLGPSPDNQTVAYIASGGYAPNDDGGRWLVEEVWPRVIEILPQAKLVIAGKGTASAYHWVTESTVHVLGEVESISAVLLDSALAVGPVRSGAGEQLKVVSALSHGRTMVLTSYSARSCPRSALENVSVTSDPSDFAAAVVSSILDVDSRHRREAQLSAGVRSWADACEPLIKWIGQCEVR